MAGVKRPRAAVLGDQHAVAAAVAAGGEVRLSRRRRRLTQQQLADRTGLSRSQIAKIETGRGAAVQFADWFALAEALGRPYRAEFLRDRLEPPPDAGHLDIEQLVVRLGQTAGYDRRVELPWRSGEATRWTDVALANARARRLLLVECVNTFGDIGASFRSSDRKLADANQLAVAIARDGPPFDVGLCWVVRATARNRELVRRYEDLFAARFPGSSRAWVQALTGGGQWPTEPVLVWCDVRATRLFEWRRVTHS